MLNGNNLKQACTLIHNNPQTYVLLEYLEIERQRCRELLESCMHPMDNIRMLQGEAQAYTKLIDTITGLAK